MAAASEADVQIREATDTDVGAVVRLATAWVEEDITLGQDVPAASWFLDHIGPYFLVACLGEEVVGFAVGEVLVGDEGVSAVLPVGTPYLEVTELYVQDGHRSARIGSGLLDALLEVATRSGVERSVVFTATRDVASVVRFYERHGYSSWGLQLFR